MLPPRSPSLPLKLHGCRPLALCPTLSTISLKMLANYARSWTLLFVFFSHTTNCTAKLILHLLCVQCQDLYSTRWWRRSSSHHWWHWRSTHGWSGRPAHAWRHSRWGSHSRWSSHPPWRTSHAHWGSSHSSRWTSHAHRWKRWSHAARWTPAHWSSHWRHPHSRWSP